MRRLFIILILVVMMMLGAVRVSAQNISLSELVELFIKLGIIAPEKASDARSAVSTSQAAQDSDCYIFARNFGLGSGGLDVGQLHKVLTAQNLYIAAGSFEFGPSAIYTAKTALSVSRFQEKYAAEILKPNGLSRGTGYVGISTRAKMNKLYGCNQTPPTPTPIQSTRPVSTPPFVPIGPELEVRSPSGGEVMKQGEAWILRWIDRGFVMTSNNSFAVELRIKNNIVCITAPCPASSYTIATNVLANNLRWTVGNTLGGTSIPDGYYYFEVCRMNSNVCDQSNTSFQIISPLALTPPTTQPSITVLSPNGGGEWQIGQSKKISWATQSIPASAYLELTLVNGPTPINVRSYNPVGSNNSLEFILPAYGIWTDYGYRLEPGSYSISAIVYDLPPCGPMIPVFPDSPCRLAKILAKDFSDAPFTITSGSIVPPPPLTPPTPPAAQVLPTITLNTTLSTVTSGSVTTIAWSSIDATSCLASGGWSGTKAVAGFQSTGMLTTQTTFTITCTGPGGTASKSVVVNVIAPPYAPALVVSCGTSQTTATVGQTVNWTASATGGTGSYLYSWSGTDALAGNLQIVSKSYLTVGSKIAVVTVTSGTQSAELACTGSVSVTTISHLLTTARQGSGSGTILGGSINCGITCSATVSASTQVTLAATPSTGSVFAGWSGACSGTGVCSFTVDGAKTITATFNLVPVVTPLRISFVGDWHNRPVTQANLRNARDYSDLLIGLGDYSYINGESPTAYCNMVKANLGTVPLLVMPGDHDDLEKGADTNGIDIRNLLPCLPVKPSSDLASAPVGVYPYRYYVDLKSSTRLIVAGGIGLKTGITEHILYADNAWHAADYKSGYNWSKDTDNYKWLEATIDSAQAPGSGIKHIIVANHEPCLDISETTYDRNRTNCTDVMDLMIKKNVDMFIHASKHHYWRSKQIGYTPSCSKFIMPTSPSGTHPSIGCIKEAVGGTQYLKGAGLLHLTVGTGGADPNGCNIATSQSDNEYPFAYASTCTKEAGIAILTIDDNKIEGVFKRSTGVVTDMYSVRR